MGKGSKPTSVVYSERIGLGLGGVYSVRQAARLLGFAEAEVWLRSAGLVVTVGRAEKVVWRDVLDTLSALRGRAAGPRPQRRSNRAPDEPEDPTDLSPADYLAKIARERGFP